MTVLSNAIFSTFICRNPHPFGLTLSRDVIFYTDLNTYRLHAIMKSNLSAIYDLELDIGSLYDVLVIDKDQKCKSTVQGLDVQSMDRGWFVVAKVLCILHHWGVLLILA